MIKYIFEVAHPKKDFKIRNRADTFNGLMKKLNVRLLLPEGYFKGCRVRFRAVEMKNNKVVKEWEEYSYRNGKIKGYFTNWETTGHSF